MGKKAKLKEIIPSYRRTKTPNPAFSQGSQSVGSSPGTRNNCLLFITSNSNTFNDYSIKFYGFIFFKQMEQQPLKR